MAYSTQNMYQMLDIIPNFVRKMFPPFSLKTYPSCTNTMAWDIRDEIRSAYILRMVHERDNQKPIIDDNACKRDNVCLKKVKKGGVGGCRSELLHNKKPSHPYTPSSRSEQLLNITNMENLESTPKSASEWFPKKLCNGRTSRIQSKPKLIHRKSRRNPNEKVRDVPSSNLSSGQTIHLERGSTSQIDLGENSNVQNPENSMAEIGAGSTVKREYQLLAQKFHHYTINCRTTIRQLEKKLKKLIDDKHALLHGMVSLRKGQKDVIKKYRKIFNDAMNEHCNEINALLANYKVIRDNYLELLQHDKSINDKNRSEEVLSVSYTSYNCS